MDCREVRKYFLSFYENRLEDDLKTLVSEHLKACSFCADFYLREKELTNRLSNLPLPKLKTNLSHTILLNYQKPDKKIGFIKWWKDSSPMLKAAAFSCAAIGIFAGFILSKKVLGLYPQTFDSPYIMAMSFSSGGLF